MTDETAQNPTIRITRHRPPTWPRRHPRQAILIALAVYVTCFSTAGYVGDAIRTVTERRRSTGALWASYDVALYRAPDGYEIGMLGDRPPEEQIGFFLIARQEGTRFGLFAPRSRYGKEELFGRWWRDGEGVPMTSVEIDRMRDEAVEVWLSDGARPDNVEPLRTPLVAYDNRCWPDMLFDGAFCSVLVLMAMASVSWAISAVANMPGDRARRRLDAGLCPNCRYPIGGLPQPRCPECGTTWIVDDEEQGGSESG